MANHSNSPAMEVSVEQAGFIPYACHLDESTLLTKNGELLQILKIEGFQFDTLYNGKKADLRLELRRLFQELALHPHFCATVHIVRRRKNLNPPAGSEGFFAANVEEKWKKTHQWQDGYSNDLYFTLVHEGDNFALKNMGQLVRSFFFQAEKLSQRRQLEKIKDRLSETMDRFVAGLAHFGARKLKVVEENGTVYSEPLSLMNHLVNLEHGKKMPMPISDISDYLVAYPVDVNFNALEVRQPSGGARHAYIYSIKQYSEMKPAAMDAFLQFPGEFIITQQITLGARPEFVASLEYKKHMAELGDDRDFIHFSGIEDLLESNRGQWSDYSMQQNTIMLMGNSAAQLETISGQFMAALGSVGVVAVREDVMLEHLYYSQLPANFEFLKRLQPINTLRVAGYATLYDFPTGKIQGNPWGPAISVLKTVKKSPYFFSFHQGPNNGHTLMAGQYGSGKTQLLNFLMAQAERLQPRVIWFDTHHSAEILVRALGGGYMPLVRNKEVARRPMNPLLLPDTPENRQFLAQWLKLLLLDLDGNMKIEPKGVDFVEAVKAIYTFPVAKRRLSNFALPLEEPLASYYQQWIGNGRYAHFFDNATDETFSGKRMDAFDMTEMVQDRRPQWALLAYLMHRTLQSLDGKPTIVVFDEAWTLFDNQVFSAQVAGWLDQLREKNAIAIFATENIDGLPLSSLTPQINPKIATRILFPDANVTENLQGLMAMSGKQYQQFLGMERDQKQVFIQQGVESVVVDMQLAEMHGIIEVLNGLPMQVTRMENVIAKVGAEPEQWLPEFLKQA